MISRSTDAANRRTFGGLSAVALGGLLAAAHVWAAPQQFGSAMPAGDALPLSQALQAPESFGEPARKFSGRVTQVCRKKGCWMMLEDDGQAARVVMHDYGFSLPLDASGRAVVHGVLGSKELSTAAAEHLAEDAGGGEARPGREYRITAYSVQLDGS